MKQITSYLINYIASSAGYSLGRLKDDPGDGTGSAATVSWANDIMYALIAPITKYLGAVSDTDESETASDFLDALERAAATIGISTHIASYDYNSGDVVFRDGITWQANADIDTGVDGTDFISQYTASKWDSLVLDTDRQLVFDGSITINTTDALHDIDFGDVDCFDLTTGDIISASALTKQMDNTFTAGTNQGMLDTGSVAASTTYYLYTIKKDSDSSGDFLASTSATSPTMPAGYTMKRAIGTLVTDASANIASVTQTVDEVKAKDLSVGLIRIQNGQILFNAEWDGVNYKYLSTGVAYRTDLSTGIEYFVASGTVGATISSWSTRADGKIEGNLEFNTTSVPPTVSSGVRDVLGKKIQETADATLATTDALGSISQTFTDHAYSWMWNVVDINGNYYYLPAFDTAGAIGTGRTVSGITVAANVATVATADTSSLLVGTIVVVRDSDAGLIIGKVVSISVGVNFTVKTSVGDGSYTGGTYDAYYRITTNHGTGTPTAVNTDANVEKYTPSPAFCDALNCYGLDEDGVPTSTAANVVYRILGPWYINASGNTTHIISYKSGQNKSDNELFMQTRGGFGSIATQIPYYTTTKRAWGSDYIMINSSTNGLSVEILRTMRCTGKAEDGANSGSSQSGISLNSTALTDSIAATANDPFRLSVDMNNTVSVTNIHSSSFPEKTLGPNNFIRPHGSGNTGIDPDLCMFQFSGRL